MSLLSIVQNAATSIGLRAPTAVVGSTDLTARMLLRFANQGGRELAKYHDWQNLIVDHEVTTVNQLAQPDSLPPDDYDRLVYCPEIWNLTLKQRYAGPTPQRVWSQLRNGVTGGVVGWWRIKRNALEIYPPPTAGQTIAFEYISKRWVESAEGESQESFRADTDEALIPEHLIELEVIWRYRHARGYAQYGEDLVTCEREKEKAASHDRGTGRIRPENRRDGDWPIQPYFNGIIETT